MLQQLSLRQIRSRVASIDNIKKVTHAMGMVATSKLKAVEKSVFSIEEYILQVESTLANILASVDEIQHPLLAEREKKNGTALCVMTSDTGLCGAYNTSVIHTAENFIESRPGEKIELVIVGRRGLNYFKKRSVNIRSSFVELKGLYPNGIFRELLGKLVDLYLSGAASEIYVAYNRFESASRCGSVLEKFLGLDYLKGKRANYIFEDAPYEILDGLLSVYLSSRVRFLLFNSYAAEQALRTIAMEEATKNAKDLQKGLVLLRNKVRQASITKEILEISSSAEVLR